MVSALERAKGATSITRLMILEGFLKRADCSVRYDAGDGVWGQLPLIRTARAVAGSLDGVGRTWS